MADGSQLIPLLKKRVFLLPRKLIVFLSLLFHPESERGVERREGCVIIPSFLLSVGGRNGWQQRKGKKERRRWKIPFGITTPRMFLFFRGVPSSLFLREWKQERDPFNDLRR